MGVYQYQDVINGCKESGKNQASVNAKYIENSGFPTKLSQGSSRFYICLQQSS